MKNKVLALFVLLVAICSTIFPASSQEAEMLKLGVKGGINVANLYTSDTSNSNMIAGFNLGVFAQLPLSDMVTIQPELYVTTKGASITYNSLFVDGTAQFNLTYLELPVVCIVKLSEHINVQFGPYVSYLVDGKVSNMANVQLFNFEQNINVNDYNRIDAGLVAGFGVVVHSITMGARYNYGLVKVGKEQTFFGATYTIPNATNGVINFYLSVPLL
jgi:hypothetical protein